VSQDRPSLAEIVRTVAEFLDGLRPKLEGESQYAALVSAYMLRIAEREVALSTALDAEEQKELAALLGRSGSLADLNRMLCESIRAGRFDDDWTRAFDVVLAQAVRKLRIVRPEHLAPVHAETQASGSARE
jgi:uncharacterized protein DUF6285